MIFAYLLSIFFPFFCISCGKEGAVLCKDCIAKSTPRPVWVSEGECWAFYSFSDTWVRKALHNMKYRGIRCVADVLVTHICNSDADNSVLKRGKQYIWIPIPVSSERRKVRGYNQAELIALSLQGHFGGTVMPHALRKQNRVSMVGRTKDERQALAAHAFSAGVVPAAEGVVVLVDDLVTTGSTLAAARSCLFSAGVTVDLALALAYED